MPAPPRFACFAVCPPGLESITRAELFRLGVNHPQALPGGVAFSGFLGHLYRVNLWSRTASRVLVRVGEFEAKSFPELERKAAGLAWESLLPASASVTVHATCHKSRLYHSEAVAERVAAAIPARLNGPAVRQRPTTTATSDSTSFFNQSHQSNTSVESAKHLPWVPVPGSVDETGAAQTEFVLIR